MNFEEFPQPARKLARVTFVVFMSAIGLITMPGIPPNTEFKPYTITPALKLEGKLQPQFALDKAVKLSDGEFNGAESIALDGNNLYFGTKKGGKIIELQDDEEKPNGKSKLPKYTIVSEYEKQCGKFLTVDFILENEEDQHCGSAIPLGIRFDQDGYLLLSDGRYGILHVDPDTDHVKHYLSMNTSINGVLPGFPNDLDVGTDGTIYWSDVFTSEGLTLTDTEALNGRLIKFNPRTNTHTVLIKDLAGGNGVQLSPKEDFVLVGETFRSRVWRYYLKGPKAGTIDIFLDGLPGLTDNIRSNGKGGFYIALFSSRSFLIDTLGQYPQLRKLIGRLQTLTLATLAVVNQIGIPKQYLNDLMEYIFYLGPFGVDMAAKPVIVDVDVNGNIERILTTQDNHEMVQVTQIIVGENYAYMGGFSTKQIWKISREDLEAKSH